MSDAVTLPVVDCWNNIGVKGDRSCPKLKDAIHCQNCEVFADAARAFLDRPVPAGYSKEVTASFARAAVSKRSETVSALVFEVGEQLLAIDTRAVVEVTSTRPVHRVGHRSGRIFAGIVNIHGQLELCCSLSGLLQIETLAGDNDKRSDDAKIRELYLLAYGRDPEPEELSLAINHLARQVKGKDCLLYTSDAADE